MGSHVRCGLGRLLTNLESHEAGVDFEVTLIISRSRRLPHQLFSSRHRQIRHAKAIYEELQSKHASISSLHFRGNVGMDIGAYNAGLQMLREKDYGGDIVFMNSSVEGPFEDGWLAKYRDQFYSNPENGLCGATVNSHCTIIPSNPFLPHVQSFFLFTNMEKMDLSFPVGLPGQRRFMSKQQAIIEGEIGLSTKVLDAGLGITCQLFPDFTFRRGDSWNIPEGDLRFQPEVCPHPNRI